MTSVIYDGYIYVIGGDRYPSDSIDSVTIINTKTGSVSMSSEKLNYPVHTVGAAISDHTIYFFGGLSGMVPLDTWSKYEYPKAW